MSKAPNALAKADARVAEVYADLRKAVFAAGPLDRSTADIAVLGAFVSNGSTTGIKVHGGRMYREGTSMEALRQIVLVTLGQAATFGQVNAALNALDEIET